MTKIVFWCPFFGKIGTEKAVINSAIALSKLKNASCTVINTMGEFDKYKIILKKNKIK